MDEGIIVNDPTRRSNGDENLAVKFYDRLVLNNYKSEKEGRPVHETVLYCSIIVPGVTPQMVDEKATNNHKERFWKQWANYQRGQSEKVEGTPVTEWSSLPRTRAEDLKHMHFITVEQIAAASDTQCQAIGPDGITLRTKARMYIATAKDGAAAEKAAADNEALRNENQLLKEQMADLANRLKAIEDGANRAPKTAKAAAVQ